MCPPCPPCKLSGIIEVHAVPAATVVTASSLLFSSLCRLLKWRGKACVVLTYFTKYKNKGLLSTWARDPNGVERVMGQPGGGPTYCVTILSEATQLHEASLPRPLLPLASVTEHPSYNHPKNDTCTKLEKSNPACWKQSSLVIMCSGPLRSR